MSNSLPVYQDFADLCAAAAEWRCCGLKVALCHGCFDPLHIGHVLHFEAARACADRLIVTVTPDRFVNKGSGRPVFSEAERVSMVAAIRFVDAAAVNLWAGAVETLYRVKPHLFVKGADYLKEAASHPGFMEERRAAEEIGAEVYLTTTPKHSSTSMLLALRLSQAPGCDS